MIKCVHSLRITNPMFSISQSLSLMRQSPTRDKEMRRRRINYTNTHHFASLHLHVYTQCSGKTSRAHHNPWLFFFFFNFLLQRNIVLLQNIKLNYSNPIGIFSSWDVTFPRDIKMPEAMYQLDSFVMRMRRFSTTLFSGGHYHTIRFHSFHVWLANKMTVRLYDITTRL
jgi:hypothetical protein